MTRRWLAAAVAAAALAGSQGCAGAGLTLFGVGAGVSGGTGVNYTLDSVAYKIFASSEDEVRGATVRALKKMAITVTENEPIESGRQIMAQAGDRTVDIEIDRITARTSRMRVVVKQGWLFRDRATAGEIIVQTQRMLGNEPLLSKSGK